MGDAAIDSPAGPNTEQWVKITAAIARAQPISADRRNLAGVKYPWRSLKRPGGGSSGQ